MILEFENFKIITDDRQFIVQEKKITQETKFTKPENVGQIYWDDIAYCSKFENALKILPKHILLKNDDLQVIKRKLNELESKIEEFKRLLELEG